MRILALTLLCIGCGGAGTNPGSVSVTLGTSGLDGSGRQSLSCDQPLIPGAQGGFHVWVKWKIEGMAPQKVHIERTVRRISDNALILTTENAQDVGSPAEDGWWTMPAALPSFMCPTPIGISVENQTVKFHLVLKADHSGNAGEILGETDATATPRCPTDGQQEFCQRICNG